MGKEQNDIALNTAVSSFLGARYKNKAYVPMQRVIQDWLQWYRGNVKGFHEYKFNNGDSTQTAERYGMNMAKRVCEDWASLLLNEKVTIDVSGRKESKLIAEVLENNNFKVEGNRLVEKAFATGTGAFIVGWSDDETTIDFISGDYIFPIKWKNGRVIDCAFANVYKVGDKEYYHLIIHEKQTKGANKGEYVIKEYYIDDLGKIANLKEVENREIQTKSTIPLFSIIKPNIVNNYDKDNPMGMAIFGNSLSQLRGCDLVFDSYSSEIELGVKRLLVAKNLLKSVSTSASNQIALQNGGALPFDSTNKLFMYIDEWKDKPPVTDINLELRTAQHREALTDMVTSVSMACGFGSSYYSLQQDMSVQTATAVVSAKDELYKNKKKHEIILEEAIINMCKAILVVNNIEAGGKFKITTEITVNFDDSIIEDDGAFKEYGLRLYSAGAITDEVLLKKYFMYTDEEIAEMAESKQEAEAKELQRLGLEFDNEEVEEE